MGCEGGGTTHGRHLPQAAWRLPQAAWRPRGHWGYHHPMCGRAMMAKTVLDLLHSLGVEDQDIRFDNFGGWYPSYIDNSGRTHTRAIIVMSPVVVVVIAFRVHCNAFRVHCKMPFASLFVVFGSCSSFRVAGSLPEGYSQHVCLGHLQLVLFCIYWLCQSFMKEEVVEFCRLGKWFSFFVDNPNGNLHTYGSSDIYICDFVKKHSQICKMCGKNLHI